MSKANSVQLAEELGIQDDQLKEIALYLNRIFKPESREEFLPELNQPMTVSKIIRMMELKDQNYWVYHRALMRFIDKLDLTYSAKQDEIDQTFRVILLALQRIYNKTADLEKDFRLKEKLLNDRIGELVEERDYFRIILASKFGVVFKQEEEQPVPEPTKVKEKEKIDYSFKPKK